ncbi:peroxidase-related enzyme [Streptomyces sp. JV176]|uniref:peroxidase-related enzyme n=1 Tax=Streptomyces sp. JV176 TaxID=858630 RepID=UPI002E75DB3C|nr:peroxidase-related enzyme [Streptomyces sp. JV176]MEE1799416.1 peroxidase-related enzyme [Streptomyces sp. JV176]
MTQRIGQHAGTGTAPRAGISEHTAATRSVLLVPSLPGTLATGLRIAAAARAAELAGQPALAAAYRDLAPGHTAEDARDDARTAAVLAFTDRVTLAPDRAGADLLASLGAQGLDAPAVVALAQICAFVAYEARVAAGLALLAGDPAARTDGPPVADRTTPGAGDAAPFTLDQLTWQPRIPAVDADALTAAQRAVIDAHATLSTASPYYRTLLHDPAALDHRTHVYNAVMYGRGGLPRAERELATLVVSRVNGCVYCASVHGRKYAQLSRDEARALRVLRDGADAFTAPGTPQAAEAGTDAVADARGSAVARFAEAQTRTPPEAGARHLAALRAAGLDDAELTDLVHAVALFGWANRLMLVLGDAHHPGSPLPDAGSPRTDARESCRGTSAPEPRTGDA